VTDFNSPIARRGTGSLKWDKRPDLDPFWVADMDFVSPPPVLDALQRRIDHGVFGYALPQPSLVEAIQGYLQTRLGVVTPEEHLVHLGGLVPALSLAARAFGKPGEALLTCTPSYPPFLGIHQDAGLELQTVHHRHLDGRWTFDWEALEAKVTPATRLFILSNPQNPLGRVFDESEIVQLATFCEKHDLILVSDEIHCDLILEEERTPHFSALHLPEDLRDRTITLLAPSKTYNIAGLGYAFAVIPNPKIRQRFTTARGHTLPEINCLAYHAAEAAYRHGEPWRQELLAHLRANRDLILSTLRTSLPQIQIPEIEATYLAWLDCTALPHDHPAQRLEEAGLFLSDGSFFGQKKCVRLNFGTTTERLRSGLDTVVSALADPK
jgi:cystathionine beta-lyase